MSLEFTGATVARRERASSLQGRIHGMSQE